MYDDPQTKNKYLNLHNIFKKFNVANVNSFPIYMKFSSHYVTLLLNNKDFLDKCYCFLALNKWDYQHLTLGGLLLPYIATLTFEDLTKCIMHLH